MHRRTRSIVLTLAAAHAGVALAQPPLPPGQAAATRGEGQKALSPSAASPLLPEPAAAARTPQYVAAVAGAGARTVARGSTVALYVDVTPQRGIHVYAPGADAYLPVSLTLQSPDAGEIGRLVYPPAQRITFAGERVPVYLKRFRLTREMTVPSSAAPGSTLVVRGLLEYQACDDAICFKPAKLPVVWTLTVR
ncbi:MAG: hypothetical protein IT176_01365 [Acidobacteria bacterium]|nr:hypothetical protein [Acidobacteriota bacterium]